MPKKPQTPHERHRPIALVTRKSINWRIPLDVLAKLDARRGKRERTACVVEALQQWLRRSAP